MCNNREVVHSRCLAQIWQMLDELLETQSGQVEPDEMIGALQLEQKCKKLGRIGQLDELL